MPNTAQLSLMSNIGQSALSIAPMTGPAAPFVAAGGAIASMIAGMIPPRGNFEKFKRTAYPYMLAQAQSTGLPVVFPWFNCELVGVEPNGGFGVVGSNQGDDDSDRENPGWVARLQKKGSFVQGVCYRNDGDCVNNPASIAFIHRPATFEASLKNTLSGITRGNNIILFVVIGLVVLFALKGK